MYNIWTDDDDKEEYLEDVFGGYANAGDYVNRGQLFTILNFAFKNNDEMTFEEYINVVKK